MGQASSVFAVQRRARVKLATLLTERPGDHDAAFPSPGQLVDRDGEPAENGFSSLGKADRDCAGAIERGPDELGCDLCRDPRARKAAVAKWAGKDAQAVAGLPLGPAHEAGRERVLFEARIREGCALGFSEAGRRRHFELEVHRLGFCNKSFSISYPSSLTVTLDEETSPQRWRRAEGDLCGLTNELGDEPACVAAIPGPRRTVEPGVYRDRLHGEYTTF